MSLKDGKLVRGIREVWTGFSGEGRLHEREHRASMDALNLFFGAIVGVNFANQSAMDVKDYAVLLFLTACLIALILIISNMSRRIWSAIQLIIIFGAYYLLTMVEKIVGEVDEKLVVTLAVWAGAALLFEFTPRDPDPEES